MKASAIKIGILVTVLIALAAGCATKEQSSGQQRPAFNHKIHVGTVGADCATCHETTGDKASMPTLDTCKTCHGDDPAKTDQFLVNGVPSWSSFTALSPELKFSHQQHIDKGQKCEDCHGNMAARERTGKDMAFKMDTCRACHAKKYAAGSNDCQTCHTKINKDVAPESHALNWKRFHGQQARAQLTEPAENRCSLCHTDQTCATCHRAEEPESHTNMWRLRGHGIAARMDRSTCATCHQSDTCDTCHSETAPMNHRGPWGGTRQNHCLVCHFPVGNENCLVCHKQLTGHLLAPLLPAGVTHATASEAGCRTCHGPTLTHPDNGDSCRTCHHQ